MSVAEAEELFGAGEGRTPAAHAILDRLADVGLGYFSLGQPLTTLSCDERQRLKLATRMAEQGGVYILDEPTTGLHLADVEQLLGLLDRLVDASKAVIVIEHHQAVMAHADWIIDLGPGAPATTAAGSSSMAPPPPSSPPVAPSPASTSRPTSAPDGGLSSVDVDEGDRHRRFVGRSVVDALVQDGLDATVVTELYRTRGHHRRGDARASEYRRCLAPRSPTGSAALA